MTDLTDQPAGATPIPDVSALLRPEITNRVQLNEAEALNLVAAFEWLEKGRLGDLFTVEFYRKLHTKMFDQVWGWAGGLRSQTGARTTPGVPPEKVGIELGRVALEASRTWEAGDSEASLIPFIANYHHDLVWVHPFNNGNGRWARLAADAVTQRLAKQRPLIWTTETLDVDGDERRTYIAAVRAADAGDIAPLIAYLEALNPGR